MEVAPADPSTVHIATTYGGFYRSEDSGSTWNPAHTGIYAHVVSALAVAPSEPETLLVDFYNIYQLTASHDCAENWQEMNYPPGCGGTIGDLLINSVDPETVLALEESG